MAQPPLEGDRPTPRERVDQARERGRERMDQARESGAERVEQARMTFRRLSGLDRSGPPPPQTRSDQPWHVWTIPNAIGFVRLALIPVFVVLAFAEEDGTGALPAIIFAVVAWSDYADGIAARLTGQYSRFGALLDPIVDRLLIISAVVVCWHFDLLPRWALAILVVREVFMLFAGRAALKRHIELGINWWGRLAVTPVMSALFAGLIGWRRVGAILLYIGVAMALVATFEYYRSARRQLAERRPST
ncbi:MAG: CDP-alcohol phosphatidyltransferase family protein [Solirubrobacteraceae bacterium]